MESKICKACGETKELSCFYSRKEAKDGYRGICKECYKYNKKENKNLQLKNIESFFENRGCKLVSREFVSWRSPLIYICKCGKENKVSFFNFRRYKMGGCNSCLISYKRKLFQRDIKEVNEILNKEGYILLSEYESQNRPIIIKCPNGHIKEIYLTNFVKGHRCQKCMFLDRCGENHPNWNPLKTDEERLIGRATPENWKFRHLVYERDDWICQLCHKRGGNLCVHHLDSFDWCIEKRYDVNNGITLCDGKNSCHELFHKTYGYGNNTKEQFIEFYEKLKTSYNKKNLL